MTYGECTNCNKWGEAPKTFNESKHFLKCPICLGPMFLVHGDPKECGLTEKQQITITEFIKHRG